MPSADAAASLCFCDRKPEHRRGFELGANAPDRLPAADDTSKQHLIRLARGDFKATAGKTMLLPSEGRLPEGSYTATRLFLVTQTSAEAPLALLPVR